MGERVVDAPAHSADDVASPADAGDATTGAADLAAQLRQAYVAHALAGLLPTRRNAFAKRALDLTLGLLLLIVALPLIGALALALSMGWIGRVANGRDGSQDRSPVFERQHYAGRGGRGFVGVSIPALTATWLRRLARLPLLLAVVRGEMSLVGPRPRLYDEWLALAGADDMPSRALLACLYVKPGLTGPWRITPHADSPHCADDTASALADPDLRYVAHGSFGRDLAILARTPFVLLH